MGQLSVASLGHEGEALLLSHRKVTDITMPQAQDFRNTWCDHRLMRSTDTPLLKVDLPVQPCQGEF